MLKEVKQLLWYCLPDSFTYSTMLPRGYHVSGSVLVIEDVAYSFLFVNELLAFMELTVKQQKTAPTHYIRETESGK